MGRLGLARAARRAAAVACGRDRSASLSTAARIRYVLSWRHPPRSADGLPNLKAIFSLGAGVDHLFADPALPDAPIVRVVDPDLRDRMSEWVVLHALAHLRQLRRYERQQRERIWADDETQPKAGDVRVGVLGLGVLGADAAMKLKALGFRVAGWSATPKSVAGRRMLFRRGGPEARCSREPTCSSSCCR